MQSTLRILLIEDNATDVLLFREALRTITGVTFEIAEAECAEDALRALDEGSFDVVLLALNLPDSVGLEAFRRLRARAPALPILVLTALDDEQMAMAAMHEGAEDYLIKGRTAADSLVRAIRYAIERRRSQELATAHQAAEQASRAKDYFLAALSHELRTPLTPVLTAIQLIQKDARLPDDLRRLANAALRNIELEVRLIDDLLDVTRIVRGKLKLDVQEVEAAPLLEGAMDMVLPQAQAKGLRVSIHTPSCDCIIRGDPTRLQQVFWNLLSNAVKFTPAPGEIRLHCEVKEARLVVEVRDTGIGIDPAFLPRLFGPFQQQDAEERHTQGLGLGLAICKGLVVAHGGDIKAVSAGTGKGSAFIVELPLVEQQKCDPAAREPERPARSEARSLRLLLVEDHPDTGWMMQELLRMQGHSVQWVQDMSSALSAVAEGNLDLIVSDLGLPDGNGLELMRRARAMKPALKGIALSGYGQREDLRKSREVGFIEHLVKPVDMERLIERVDRLAGEIGAAAQ